MAINNQKKNEQVLYIGLEENITDVRERLNHIESHHITLVVPAQTQLRGQVSWKLLSSRARERGQDIYIVSSDPYVRAMARSVHLHVTSSLPEARY